MRALRIAVFEVRRRFGQMSTYVYAAMFFTIALMVVLAAGGAFKQANVIVGGSGGKLMVNSPFVLFILISIIHHFGIIVTAAMMGQAVYQDFLYRTHPLFFSSPVHKIEYLLGRFLGNFFVLLFVFSSIGFGCWVASLLPFVDAKYFFENKLINYVYPYLVSVIPNLFVTGALFFSLAALTRKITPVYVASVVMLIGYLIASSLTDKLEWKQAAAILDPFGTNAIDFVTKYWTVADRNTKLIPLAGELLWNRVVWLAVAGIVFAVCCWQFRMAHGNERRSLRDDASGLDDIALSTVPATPVRDFRSLRLLPGLTFLNFRETVKNVYFVVITLAGVLFVILAAQSMEAIFGTETYPVTALVAELTQGSFGLFMLIIITFYAGELVWRERDANVHQLMDVLPTPDWLPLVAKILALILVQALLLGVVLLCGITIQAVNGYFRFELDVYLKHLGLGLIEYSLLSVLAITVQTLVAHKYLGHFVMVLYYLMVTFMGQFGYEHNLLQYGRGPGFTYSDMNRFGHFLLGVHWFNAYWALWAIGMALIATLFWVRGTDTTWNSRWRQARQRWSLSLGWSFALTLIAIGLTGGWIFYNTTKLNPFRTRYVSQSLSADYERNYKSLSELPQPRITNIDVKLDIFPEQRTLNVVGTSTLTNKTQTPISKVYVLCDPDTEFTLLQLNGASASTIDKDYGLHTFELAEPLLPQATAPLAYEFSSSSRGFTNSADTSSPVMFNGTFFNSSILPSIGYDANRELSADGVRRKFGLKEKERMASVDDLRARSNNYISNDADWVTLNAIVSTTPDQTAIVPGYLQREWTEDGRRYFHYRTDGRILNFFSVISARYNVVRDKWHGKVSFGKGSGEGDSAAEADQAFEGTNQDVSIEIYHHPAHAYNVPSMVDAIKKALDYYTVNFSPYQHRQVRILEFPRYAGFAQSFPNTIPYSESVGFVARVNPSDPSDVNYPFYVTAHEIAHQWWAHQVIGGNVQGATVMSETLSQYSALMVMKKEFGTDKMKRFLRYELEQYLMGRATERKKELPLILVENQGYVHYNKGSLVMYALQDYIGEDRVNRALAKYIRSVGYQEPPYTNSKEFLAFIREETPAEYQYLIEDLFETITLFDNRAVSADATARDDGQWDVKIKVNSKKFRADELGEDKEIQLRDWIDIGVLDANDLPLVLERKEITQTDSEFSFVVAKQPAKAGIDPLNKLIDRRPEDNVLPVELK
jgi:ABC-2 type transport system permease protein